MRERPWWSGWRGAWFAWAVPGSIRREAYRAARAVRRSLSSCDPAARLGSTMTRPLVPAFLARGSHAAVVAPHHLATAAGLGILRAGGTAVDAAIATNAVLAVVDNYACGIGGDAFWLIWDAREARQTGLNGSGRSAAKASAAALRSRGLGTVPHRGGLSITVPGAVRSWGDAHDRFGR